MAKAKPASNPLRYIGPVSSFSVVTGDQISALLKKGEINFIAQTRPLVTGHTYDDLPTDHPVISNLIAAKLLIPPPDGDQPAASSQAAVSDSANGTDDGASSSEGKAQ